MTPEERANELFIKISPFCHGGKGTWLERDSAKQICIVFCDEIMSVIEQMDEDRGRKEEFRPLAEYSYWDLVKQHIQSL